MLSCIHNCGRSLRIEAKQLLLLPEMQAFSVNTLPHITEKSYDTDYLSHYAHEDFMLDPDMEFQFRV